MSHLTSRCVVMVFVVASMSSVVSAAPRITVSAGEVYREGSIVKADMPASAGKGPWALRDQDDDEAPVVFGEVGPDGRMWFAVDKLKAGESRTYELVPNEGGGAVGPFPTIRRDRDVFRIFEERPFVDPKELNILRYQKEPGTLPKGYDASLLRGGYIQSVFTPSGVLVSDDYPPKHKHHHGIWSSWTKTVFEGRSPDFWNMGEKTGRVEFVSADEPWDARPTAVGFRARHRMVDLTAGPEPRPVINEEWDVTAYGPWMGAGPARVFDLVITQTTASESPLQLPKYHYGGLGFRGHRQWDGKDNCKFLTSEGKTRADGNETRARWCHVGGLVDGKPAGIAILCHPDNFRFPQPVRLHPEEPFFCFAPSQLGDWSIEPGKPYVARYRFVVTDGEPNAVEIERRWRDYAEPVKATVE